jgi:hypothetical protein
MNVSAPIARKPTLRKLIAVGAASALLSILGALLVYIGMEGSAGAMQLLALVPVAVIVGLLLGVLGGEGSAAAIGVGCFSGLLLLWTPVVVVTYGFALLSVPVIAIYVFIVVRSSKLGASLLAARKGSDPWV